MTVPPPAPPPQRDRRPIFLRPALYTRSALFIFSLLVFVLALTLLREGARQLGPLIIDLLDVRNALDALGFGWLFAYGVMSGSPVAAVSLTFLDAGVLDKMQSFWMIGGSRLGASFIVLFVGFLYMLRGGERKSSMSTGILSLLVTQTSYFPALLLGGAILQSGWLDAWQITQAVETTTVFDLLFDPLIAFLLSFLPRWALFGLGFLIMLASFNLMDRALPQIHLGQSEFRGMARILYRPIVTFLLGALVTTATMSVSISLSILVPLSARGYVRRENIIPYVMGANITTFIDTLMAAVLLGSPPAFTVVLINMISIGAVSALIITLFYRQYEGALLGFANLMLTDRRWLTVYMFSIVAVPLILLLL